MMQLARAVRLYKSHEAAIAAYKNQHWLNQDKEAELVQQLETSIRLYKSEEAAISAYIEAGQGWLTEGRDEEAEIAAYIDADRIELLRELPLAYLQHHEEEMIA